MVSALQVPETHPIRDAATLILTRSGPAGTEVLMGQRGISAVFMPSKYVFPGGAVDIADGDVPLAGVLNPICHARLAQGIPTPASLAVAAIRELWEETGLRLGRAGKRGEGTAWQGFGAPGLLPDATGLRFIFRAITPPGRTAAFRRALLSC